MNFKELLYEKQIKFTKQRKRIIDVLESSNKPLSLDEIQSQCKEIDFSSVYRTIKLLIENHIVAEHYFGDRKPKYSLQLSKKHNHFIKCIKCGKIEEIKNVCIIDEVNRKTDYKILDHYMEFTGLCPKCSKK